MAFWDRWRKPSPALPAADVAIRSGALPSALHSGAPLAAGLEDAFAAGVRLLAAGHAQQALTCFQRAIDTGSADAAGHLGQARSYAALGRIEDALDSLEVTLALDPCHVPALQLAGQLRRERGEIDAALAVLRRALEHEPPQAALLAEYALALNAAGDALGAAQAYEQALIVAPDDPGPRINLGLLHLQQFGRFDVAEQCFRQALEASPGHAAALANLGLALYAQSRHDEALQLFDEALARHPEDVELRWNRGLVNLSLGRFRQGWRDYSLRLRRKGARRLGGLPWPIWQGQRLPSGRLLVLAEQGLGDEIMFASCLNDACDRVGHVVVECDARLGALFKRSFPRVGVLERGSAGDGAVIDPSLSFDAVVPAGDLPGIFRTDRSCFPDLPSYLHADAERVAFWRRRLDALGPGLKVGLSWVGGVTRTRRALRSLALADFEPAFRLRGVQFVNLQYSQSAAEIAELQRTSGQLVHDWPEAIADYDETAALVTALDVVLTVTTSLVHLTGALGRPAIVLVPTFAEWRYLAAGERMPWYPSVRLLRQQQPGAWVDVVRRACAELESMRARVQSVGQHDV